MKTLLLIVDVQNFFINKYTKDIPKKISSFIEKNKFDYILFFKFVNNKESNWSKSGWKKMMKGNETQIASELKKHFNKNNTFLKTSFSVFRSERFKKFVKANNINNLFTA